MRSAFIQTNECYWHKILSVSIRLIQKWSIENIIFGIKNQYWLNFARIIRHRMYINPLAASCFLFKHFLSKFKLSMWALHCFLSSLRLILTFPFISLVHTINFIDTPLGQVVSLIYGRQGFYWCFPEYRPRVYFSR